MRAFPSPGDATWWWGGGRYFKRELPCRIRNWQYAGGCLYLGFIVTSHVWLQEAYINPCISRVASQGLAFPLTPPMCPALKTGLTGFKQIHNFLSHIMAAIMLQQPQCKVPTSLLPVYSRAQGGQSGDLVRGFSSRGYIAKTKSAPLHMLTTCFAGGQEICHLLSCMSCVGMIFM